MTSDALGQYYYNYNIPSNAMYGMYNAQAAATSSGAQTAISRKYFYIMPWNSIDDVRQVMGLSETKDITDDNLSTIVWSSYQYALRDTFIHYYEEEPSPDVHNGYWFDGSNVDFQTQHFPLADIGGDGVILGSGDTTSCVSDITVYWVDTNGTYQEGKVKVNKPVRGEIKIYQYDGTSPIPSTQQGVYLDYWTKSWRYNEYLFRQAVVRLSCHEVSKRLVSMDKVTLADIRGNNPLVVIDPNMYMKEYNRYIRKNCELALGGV